MSAIQKGDRVVRRRGRSRIGTVVSVWHRPSSLGAAAMRIHPCATVRWGSTSTSVEIVRLADLRIVEE
jgi:hypothetical protein